MTKQEKFSIRKTPRGAVSARIATIGFLALSGLGLGQEVQADSLTTPAADTVVEVTHDEATCSLEKESVTPEELQDAEENLKLAEGQVQSAQETFNQAEQDQKAAQDKVDQEQARFEGLGDPSAPAIEQAGKDLSEARVAVEGLTKEVEGLTTGVNQASDDLKRAQETEATKANEVTAAQGALNQIQEQYDQVKRSDSETSDAVKAAEEELLAKEQAKNEAAKLKEAAEKGEQSAKLALTNQDTAVGEARDKVTEAESAQNRANQALKEAEETEKAAREALSGAESNLKEKEDAIKTSTSNLDKANTAADKAQKAYDALLAQNQETLKNLEDTLAKAGPEVKKEVREVVLANSSVLDSDSFTEGRLGGLGANEDVRFAGERTETIPVSREELNTPRPIDYGKVARYAREYLVELRRLNGIDIPVPEVTEKAVNWAKARTSELERLGDIDHTTNLNPREFGLSSRLVNPRNSSGTSENLGAGTVSETIVRKTEQELAYEILLRYFHDYFNTSEGYGHRNLLLDGSGDGFAIYGVGTFDILVFVAETEGKSARGVFPSKIDDKFLSKWGEIREINGTLFKPSPEGGYVSILVSELVEVKNEDADPSKSEYYFNGKRISFLPKTTFRYVTTEEVEVENEAYKTALKTLNDFKEKAKSDEQEALKILNQRVQERDTAQTTLNNLLTEQTGLVTRVSQARQQVNTATDQVATAQNNQSKANEILQTAKTKLIEVEQKRQELSKKHETAQNNLRQATENLQTAESNLQQAKNDLAQLDQSRQQVLELKGQLDQSKEQVERLQEELEEAKERVRSVQAEKGKQEQLLTERQQSLTTAKQNLSKAQEVFANLLKGKAGFEEVRKTLEAAQKELETVNQNLESARKELANRRQVRDAQQALLDCLKGLPLKDKDTGGDKEPGDTPDTGGDKAPGDTPDTGGDKAPGDTPDVGGDKAPGDTPDTGGDKAPGDTPDVGGDKAPGDTPDTGGDKEPGDTPDVGGDKEPGDTPDTGGDKKPDDTPDTDHSKKPDGRPGSKSGQLVTPHVTKVAQRTSQAPAATQNSLDTKTASASGRTLPSTGEVASVLGLVGLAVCGLAILGLAMRKN